MDIGSMGGRVEEWVMDRYQGRGSVSKRELVSEAQGSGLPAEAIEAIAALPDEGSWSPKTAVHEITDILETRAGGGARGDANVPGGGGYGRSR